jgi:hypothetical protein
VVSNDSTATVPTSVPKIGEPVAPYYWGNSFQHYCDMVNIAFDKANEILKPLESVWSIKAPRLFWNCETQCAELYIENAYYRKGTSFNGSVHFNRSLYSKFSSFPTSKFNSNDALEQIYEIQLYSQAGQTTHLYTIGTGGSTYMKIKQEYSTISNWSAISSIVFTSNTMPIIPTQIADPKIYNVNKQIITNTSSGVNQSNIISDMATLDLCYKSTLMYVPSAEYRYISMFGNNDLHNVDIQVYFKDRYGNMYPFYLAPAGSFSMKILFKLNEK